MNVFELFASITLNSKGYKDALQQAQGDTQQTGGRISSSFSNVSDKVQKALSTMAKVGASAIAVTEAGIVKLAKSSLNAYAQYEQLVGGVDKLFGESASKVKAYAETAYTEAGLSANEYMETVTGFSASLIQSLGQDTSKSADYANRAIKDMSDNANTFGTDISSIQWAYQGFAKQNYTMLDNLKLGYGGTKEEMQRLIKDSAQMKDIQQQLGVSIDKNSLSFATCVDAISVMQVAMGIAGTTSKEASKTVEGSINSMKASFKNLITGIGNSEADLNGLFNKFTDSVKVAFNNILPVVKTSLEKIPQLVGGLIDVVGDNFDAVFGTAIDSALEIVLKLGAELPKIFTKIFDTLPSILNKLFKKIGVDVDFTGLFRGLEDVIKGLAKAFQPLLSVIVNVFKTALKVIEPVGQALQKIGENEYILDFIKNLAVEFLILKGAQEAYNIVLGITNALMNANPIGLVVAGLGLLAGAYVTASTKGELYGETVKNEREEHINLADAVDAERESKRKLQDAMDSITDAQIAYTEAVKNNREAQQALNKAQQETGLSGKSLYDQVENGTLSYKNMTDKQAKVYTAYLKAKQGAEAEKKALDEISEAHKKASEEAKKHTNDELDTALATAQKSGNYEEYARKITEAVDTGALKADEIKERISKTMNSIDGDTKRTFAENIPNDLLISSGATDTYIQKVVNAYSRGEISADEAADQIVSATQNMDAQSRATFFESIPDALSETNTSYGVSGTEADTLYTTLDGKYKAISSSAATEFEEHIPQTIKGMMSTDKYAGAIEGFVSLFQNAWNRISGIFSNIMSMIPGVSNVWSKVNGLFGSVQKSTSSDATSTQRGYSFGGVSAVRNDNNPSIAGRKIIKDGNFPSGFITINIDGAKYSNEENLAKAISYQLEKTLRKGRAVWA